MIYIFTGQILQSKHSELAIYPIIIVHNYTCSTSLELSSVFSSFDSISSISSSSKVSGVADESRSISISVSSKLPTGMPITIATGYLPACCLHNIMLSY